MCAAAVQRDSEGGKRSGCPAHPLEPLSHPRWAGIPPSQPLRWTCCGRTPRAPAHPSAAPLSEGLTWPAPRPSGRGGAGAPSRQLPVTTPLQRASPGLGWLAPRLPPLCHSRWTCPPGYGSGHALGPHEVTRPALAPTRPSLGPAVSVTDSDPQALGGQDAPGGT